MTDANDFELSPDTAGPYLRRHGVVPDDASPSARSLGGGVSNHVVEVTWDGDCLVAKQPRPNLAVDDDWPADVSRVHNEAAAARAYARVIADAGLDDARVPGVAFEDDDAHVVAIECAPDDATMWKRELLRGRVDDAVARTVGRVLGAVHAAAADDDALRARFRDKGPFDQLRVDPYHRTTAERHPEVREVVLAEAERVLSVDRTLVHGDYSPKNVLVDRDGGEPSAARQASSGERTVGWRVSSDHRSDVVSGERNGGGPPTAWVLDFEVAHWGDPAFDTAFMLNHLFIKSVYNADRHGAYVRAAGAFWDAYRERVPWDIEAETVAELAVLMLARVDGKSPVEYVDAGPVADALRSVAVGALTDRVTTLEAFADRAGEAAAAR